MLEATTSFCTGCSISASISTAVPASFTETYRSTSYMLWPTPTAAARWNTASTPSSARRTASRSRTSAAISSTSRER